MAKEFVRIFFAFFKTLSRFLLLLCSCSSCPVSEIDYYSTFCYFQSSHTPMKQKKTNLLPADLIGCDASRSRKQFVWGVRDKLKNKMASAKQENNAEGGVAREGGAQTKGAGSLLSTTNIFHQFACQLLLIVTTKMFNFIFFLKSIISASSRWRWSRNSPVHF
jgi:hypothetical protein